jgi:hypothetical protein
MEQKMTARLKLIKVERHISRHQGESGHAIGCSPHPARGRSVKRAI